MPGPYRSKTSRFTSLHDAQTQPLLLFTHPPSPLPNHGSRSTKNQWYPLTSDPRHRCISQYVLLADFAAKYTSTLIYPPLPKNARFSQSKELPPGPWLPQSKKAIPLQAWTGPKGSKRLRLPDFKTIGTYRW